MNIKQLLTVVSCATILFWVIWISIVSQINPFETDFFGFLLFYLTLLFSLLGTFFLASFAFRKAFNKFSLEYSIVGTSFRQSFFFALLVDSILILQGAKMLNILNTILLVAAVVVLEFFFLSYKKRI
ncbi:hypothetical protein GW933_01785 [Candidatus Falkowbacteria bacterium]|uniref:Uncharacterized protein n=1 Tax=Candidatus Buchananbacteria bacterium CG10_big_fil_rev_8_21_14_0_10_33_19 TaxID=1974525 RepID=A0A2H0W3P5_9BACT|nr:hypothetical protein [Candidatus Falkowbacteria bacterium]PIS05979.1 MAG: hypothetical protein COT80_04400 [Candidatus Buchananbacteria bacterium CG10_big_fil_rev_8_21_14_0_10_33_19]